MNNHQFCFAIGLFLAIGIIAINSHTLPDRNAINTWICNDYETHRKMKVVFISEGIEYMKNEVLEKIWETIRNENLEPTEILALYDHCSQVPDINRDPIIRWDCRNKATIQRLWGRSKFDRPDNSCDPIMTRFKLRYWNITELSNNK